MRIVIVLKPYSIEVYSQEAGVYTFVSAEQNTRIEGESLYDYENRMIFVCKNMCAEMRASAYFKEITHKIQGIDVILTTPWCTYEVMHIEKDFGKKTKITDALIASVCVKKDEKDLRIIESYMSRILLNGYTVERIGGQLAQQIELQYVHVYAQESFVSSLIKSLESIFHTHKVTVSSIYGLIEYISQTKNTKETSELKIILEEESMDISYISEGLHITSIFIPYSQSSMELDISLKLSVDIDVTRQILQSRNEFLQNGVFPSMHANAKKVWPDLDVSTKQMIEEIISTHMEKIVQHIRDYIDTIDVEILKTAVFLTVYGVNSHIAFVYGTELAKKISSDPYISMKVPLFMQKDSIVSIF